MLPGINELVTNVLALLLRTSCYHAGNSLAGDTEAEWKQNLLLFFNLLCALALGFKFFPFFFFVFLFITFPSHFFTSFIFFFFFFLVASMRFRLRHAVFPTFILLAEEVNWTVCGGANKSKTEIRRGAEVKRLDTNCVEHPLKYVCHLSAHVDNSCSSSRDSRYPKFLHINYFLDGSKLNINLFSSYQLQQPVNTTRNFHE